MRNSHPIMVGSIWVLTVIGALFALLVFMGTSWNGVRQHKIETSYLYAIRLPSVAAILAGGLLCSGWRDANFTRNLSLTLPVLLFSSLVVVMAIRFCFGVFQ